MEVQTCAFESPTITNSNYYYGKINICSVIMCFLIIYSTAISIVLSVKQLIQVIKEEELIKEDVVTEEELIKEHVVTEEEIIKEDVVTEEELIKEEVVKEVINVEDEEKNKEELQSKYKKQIQLLFEKKIKNSSLHASPTLFWDMLKKENLDKEASRFRRLDGYAYEDLYSLTVSVKPITDILGSLHRINRETIDKELNEEIIFNAKKAGLFVFHSDYDEIEFFKDTYELFKIVKMVDFSNMSYEKIHARQNKSSQCFEEYRDKMKWKA